MQLNDQKYSIYETNSMVIYSAAFWMRHRFCCCNCRYGIVLIFCDGNKKTMNFNGLNPGYCFLYMVSKVVWFCRKLKIMFPIEDEFLINFFDWFESNFGITNITNRKDWMKTRLKIKRIQNIRIEIKYVFIEMSVEFHFNGFIKMLNLFTQ